MELFVPSILILLAAAILMFGVFPNTSPFVLVVIAIALLVAAGYHHHVLFQDEYKLSTWQNSVTSATVPFLITVIVLFMVGYLLNFFGGRSAAASVPKTNTGPKAPNTSKNFTTIQRQALESLIRNP
jgi:hypothetical protein